MSSTGHFSGTNKFQKRNQIFAPGAAERGRCCDAAVAMTWDLVALFSVWLRVFPGLTGSDEPSFDLLFHSVAVPLTQPLSPA